MNAFCAAMLLLSALVSGAAMAETPNQRASREAASFFVSCDAAVAELRKYCPDRQKQFTESFIMAEAGQTYFMGDLIGFLDPSNAMPETGIRHDKVEACAWRMIRAEIEGTLDPTVGRGYMQALHDACAPLDPDQKAAVITRASAHLQLMAKAPTTPLPELRGFPSTPRLPPLKSLPRNP